MAQNNNILIGSPGIASQSNTIMIGDTPTATFGSPQTACYVAGIYNTPITNGKGVSIDSNGKLGTVGTFSVALVKFLYIQQTNAPNVTGDGTSYVIGSSVALTKIFDSNNNVTTSGVFTAPVSGYYTLIFGSCINNLVNCITAGPNYVKGQNGGMSIVIVGTDAATYSFATPWSLSGCGPGGLQPNIGFLSGCDQQSATVSISIHMTAGDTATFTAGLVGFAGTGAGTKITGIGPIGTNSYTTTSTFISGYLEY